MRLVEDDQMADALATGRADGPFGTGILSGTARRDRSVANTHGAKALLEWLAMGTVAIMDKVPWRRTPREGLAELAGEPLCRRMRRHGERQQRRRSCRRMTKPCKS